MLSKRTFAVCAVLLTITGAVSASEPIQPARSQPTATSQAASTEAIRSQYAAMVKKGAEDQVETHKKYLELMAKNEAMIKRQEHNLDRFDKILATWERQQAQYQRYLDSLSQKRK